MSLDFFTEPMDRIRQFLQSRELTVLIVRHEPDLDQILQKFLVALDQDERNPAVPVGVQAAYGGQTANPPSPLDHPGRVDVSW